MSKNQKSFVLNAAMITCLAASIYGFGISLDSKDGKRDGQMTKENSDTWWATGMISSFLTGMVGAGIRSKLKV